MKQHRWHKEIKAWADGAQIERRYLRTDNEWSIWVETDNPSWSETGEDEFRIKPHPKPVQYLYVYKMHNGVDAGFTVGEIQETPFAKYVGKIKLEVDDE